MPGTVLGWFTTSRKDTKELKTTTRRLSPFTPITPYFSVIWEWWVDSWFTYSTLINQSLQKCFDYLFFIRSNTPWINQRNHWPHSVEVSGRIRLIPFASSIGPRFCSHWVGWMTPSRSLKNWSTSFQRSPWSTSSLLRYASPAARPVLLVEHYKNSFPLSFQIYSKKGETHQALLHFSWATDLDPKGANNQIKESIEPVLSRSLSVANLAEARDSDSNESEGDEGGGGGDTMEITNQSDADTTEWANYLGYVLQFWKGRGNLLVLPLPKYRACQMKNIVFHNFKRLYQLNPPWLVYLYASPRSFFFRI